jgi:hypothetical protein
LLLALVWPAADAVPQARVRLAPSSAAAKMGVDFMENSLDCGEQDRHAARAAIAGKVILRQF